MRTRKKLYLYIVKFLIVALILTFLTLCILYIPLVRVTPKNPTFQIGWRWVSSNPEIDVVCNETGTITGYIVINEKKVNLEVLTLARHMDFCIKDENDNRETWLLRGDFKISHGNIILKNIDYIDDNLGVHEIKLIKQTDC